MRPILSYHDIAPPAPAPSLRVPLTGPSNPRGRRHSSDPSRPHPDDPDFNHLSSTSKTPSQVRRAPAPKKWEPKSRELTHEEIWDDSALIDAWDAAMEEYEALNGPGKSWKAEPVNKSPLWYNVPAPTRDADPSEDAMDEEDSRPLDFDQYVPDHDPSLLQTLEPNYTTGQWTFDEQDVFAQPFNESESASDAPFQKAMQAWYWAGYWTAMYHASKAKQSQIIDRKPPTPVDEEEDEDHELPAQRD